MSLQLRAQDGEGFAVSCPNCDQDNNDFYGLRSLSNEGGCEHVAQMRYTCNECGNPFMLVIHNHKGQLRIFTQV